MYLLHISNTVSINKKVPYCLESNNIVEHFSHSSKCYLFPLLQGEDKKDNNKKKLLLKLNKKKQHPFLSHKYAIGICIKSLCIPCVIKPLL